MLTDLVMSSPNRIKAIVLTYDRYRVMTQHLIVQYERLWPDHPFVFHIPYQELGGIDSERIKYLTSPADIKATVLHLLANIDDEEWIYWCVDDKYPIQLVTDKIASLISHAMRSPEVDGLLFCRCRATLNSPKLALYPCKIVGFLLLNQTCSQSVRSRVQSALLPTHEAHRCNISNNVRGSNGYTAAATPSESPVSCRPIGSHWPNFRSA